MAGRKRVHIASITNTPAARAAVMIASVSTTEVVNAFSTRTAFPAAIAASARSVCWACGVAR